MDLLRKVFFLFSTKERYQLIGIFSVMFVGALLEAIGIGLILPFISLINNPEVISKKKILSNLYKFGHFNSYNQFILWCGIGFIVVFLFKNLYSFFQIYVQNKFIFNKEYNLNRTLLESYVRQTYPFHLQRNSAELIHNLGNASRIFDGILLPLMMSLVELMVLGTIVAMLLVVRPIPALISIAVLGGSTYAFYRSFKKLVKRAGQERTQYGGEVVKWISQSLGGIKEIKVLGRETYFIETYAGFLWKHTRASQVIFVINQLPKLFIEFICVAGIVLLICVACLRGQNPADSIPTLSLLGLSAVRLMPSLNRIVSCMTLMRACKPSLDSVFKDLKEDSGLIGSSRLGQASMEKEFLLRDSIELRNVSYLYPESNKFAVKDVSLLIPKGNSVAFVGPSGAGKSTLVDLILGLLSPSSGQILVDGIDIQKYLKNWQKNIGYIPQNIYLSDDSIRRNVAFGIKDHEIDDASVWAALKAAQLESFVRESPQGLDTFVGERGIRLSGGQRQRIGIARALYHNPSVLVLDEATSALDNETEREVTDAIDRLSGEKTLLVIAHRLTTAEKCSRIYKLNQGKIMATGNFQEVCGVL